MLNYRYNLFLISRTLLGTLAHTDWRGSYARGGMLGWLRALGMGLVGLNAWPIFVHAHRGWTREKLTGHLQAQGIVSWGWGYAGGELFFRVRRDQGWLAQQTLLDQGVPIRGRLLADADTDAQPRLEAQTEAQAEAWTGQPNRA